MSQTQSRSWTRVKGATVVVQCLARTFRLAGSVAEARDLLGLLWKTVAWQLGRHDRTAPDVTVTLGGVTHVIGLGTGELLTPQEIYFERSYEQFADFVVEKGWVVFDVGANVGVFTVQQAIRGARVFAFEPNPDCYRRLIKAVAANGVESRVVASNIAVGACAGTDRLRVLWGMTTVGSLRLDSNLVAQAEWDVNVESLDTLADSFGVQHIDLLKVDVEGFEMEVLRGGTRMLDHTDRLIIEYHSNDLKQQIIDLLTVDDAFTVADARSHTFETVGLLFAVRRGASAGLLSAKVL